MNTKHLRGNYRRKYLKRAARKLCMAHKRKYNVLRLQKAVDQLVHSIKATI